jgi:hypothetical protein
VTRVCDVVCCLGRWVPTGATAAACLLWACHASGASIQGLPLRSHCCLTPFSSQPPHPAATAASTPAHTRLIPLSHLPQSQDSKLKANAEEVERLHDRVRSEAAQKVELQESLFEARALYASVVSDR